MDKKLKELRDDEILYLMQSNEPINKARKEFSNWSAKIEQTFQQRTKPTPIELRRMEFQAVLDITKTLGKKLEY